MPDVAGYDPYHAGTTYPEDAIDVIPTVLDGMTEPSAVIAARSRVYKFVWSERLLQDCNVHAIPPSRFGLVGWRV